jgi:hypothetical protein
MFQFLNFKQRAALGAVVSECATLESTLDMMISAMTKLGEVELDILIGGAMLGRKIDILKDLGILKLKSKKKKNKFAHIMGSLSSLNSDRVTIVHGAWSPPGGKMPLSWLATGIPQSVNAEAVHRKYGKTKTFKAEKLDETAAAIDTCHSDLWNFWMGNFIQPKVRRSLKRDEKTSKTAA